MESGVIADSQLSALSVFNAYHDTNRARLHTKEISNQARGAWSSLTNDLTQWLQIDLGQVTNVTHIATQGRNGYSVMQCVKQYKLQYSDNGVTFLFHKMGGQSSDTVSSF